MPENKELLSDLVEISRIELESDDEEASEMQLIEVTEHVRIAVLHLYHDLGWNVRRTHSTIRPFINLLTII